MPNASFSVAWKGSLGAVAKGIHLGRETADLLAWDETTLTLFDRRGKTQARRTFAGPVRAAAADDGSAYALGNQAGLLAWLDPDLTPRWEKQLDSPVQGIALDSFGQMLAVSAGRGVLKFFDKSGQLRLESSAPLAFQYLAYAIESPILIGAAELGLIMCLDLARNTWRWQDRPVANVGSLALSGTGHICMLACYTSGVRRYDSLGKLMPDLPSIPPVRAATMNYLGTLYATADLKGTVQLFEHTGKPGRSYQLEAPAVALDLSPLGEYLIAALTDGSIVALDLTRPAQ